MEKSTYRVADPAPARVNGKRVCAGELLELTAAEALYERDLGHIVPEAPPSPAPAGKKPREPRVETPAADAAAEI